MAIDFPNSPTVGQIYTVGNKSWQWDGTTWLAYGASLSPTVLKVDTTNNRVGINNQSPISALDVNGQVIARYAAGTNSVSIAGNAGSGGYNASLSSVALTGNRTMYLPDKDGTVATTADLGLYFIASGTFSAVTSVSVNNCFSSTYRNYRIVIGELSHSTTSVNRIRMRVGGVDNSATAWDYAYRGIYATGAATDNTNTTQTGLYVGDTNSTVTGVSSFSFDVYSPYMAQRTIFMGQILNLYTAFFSENGGGVHNVTSSFDGFTLYTSAGTISGNYQVYGYRQA